MTSPTVRLRPVWSRVLIGLFVLTILLPGVGLVLGLDAASLKGENRALAPFPSTALDWPTLHGFPDAFTRYFEDHFAFRPRLVRWQAAFRLKMLHVSPSSDVVLGRDGWFFYADDGAREDFGPNEPFPPTELETWRVTLQHTQDWLAAKGIAYVFVIAPDKHAIYPEFLPRSLRPLRQESRIDDLVRYLAEHSTVNVLDLRPALLEAKARERIYHRTDTHWNDRGVYVAYREILEHIKPPLADVQAFDRSAFMPREAHTDGLDLAGMLGLTTELNEQDLQLIPRRRRVAVTVEPEAPEPHGIEARLVTEIPGSPLPRALIVRDSFVSTLIPFLSEHFSRAVYLWEYDVDPRTVTAERPDVVIQEWVGRRLQTQLPYDYVAAMETP